MILGNGMELSGEDFCIVFWNFFRIFIQKSFYKPIRPS